MADHELLRGWAVTLARHVGVGVLGLVWLTVLTRVLESDEVGRVVLAATLPALLVPLLSVGVPMALTYLTASTSHDRDVMGRWGRGVAVRLAIGSAVLVGALAVALELTSAGVDDHVLVALAAVPPALVAALAAAWFQGQRRFGTQARILVAPHVLTVVGTGGCAAFAAASPGTIVAVIVASHSVVGLVALLAMPAGPVTDRRAVSLAAWTHSWRMWLSEAGAALRARLDLVVVAAMMSAFDTSLFATAATLAGQIALVSLGANQVVFPLVASRAKSGDGADATAMASRLTFLLTLLAAGVVAVLAGPLLSALYGDDFAAGTDVLIAYLPAVVLLSISRIVTADLYGRGETATVLRISMIATAVSLATLPVGVALWGAVGASLSASVTAAINTGLRVRAWWALTGQRQSLIAFGRRDLAALRSALVADAAPVR